MNRDMIIEFNKGMEVNAHFDSRVLSTDQPPPRGDGSAPSPFDLFLVSIGTCTGFYILNFCRQRDLPTDDVRIVEHIEVDDASHMVKRINLEIQVPLGFPEKYRQALVRVANQCTVKNILKPHPNLSVTQRLLRRESYRNAIWKPRIFGRRFF